MLSLRPPQAVSTHGRSFIQARSGGACLRLARRFDKLSVNGWVFVRGNGQAGGYGRIFRRRSSVNGNSRLPGSSIVAGGTASRPGVCPMREKRARRRLSAS